MKAYSEREHDRAIEQHNRRYDEMKAAARKFGRDSTPYRQTHEAVVDAAREVRRASRRPGRRIYAR